MARKAKDVTNESSGYDAGLVQELLRRVDECTADLLTERGRYMQKCQSIREDIAGIYEEATARGVPGKALKKLVKARAALAKVQAEIGELEEEQYETILKIAQGGAVKPVLDLFGFADAKEAESNVVDLGKSKRKAKATASEDSAAVEGDAAQTLN